MTPPQTAVVLPELHVQRAVQAVLNVPVASHYVHETVGIDRQAGDVPTQGTLATTILSLPFRLQAQQAAQTGPPLLADHPLAEAGATQDRGLAPFPPAMALCEALTAVLCFRGIGSPFGIHMGRYHLGVQDGLVAFERQQVVGTGVLQLPDQGLLATGGIDGDDGVLQVQAVQQPLEGRTFAADRFDVVDDGRLCVESGHGREWRTRTGKAAIAFQAAQQGQLFPADVGPGSPVDYDVEVEVRTEHAAAEIPLGLGLGDGLLELPPREVVLAPNVDVGAFGLYGVGRDDDRFEQLVRVVFHDAPVLERTGLGFIRVDDQIARECIGCQKAPFDPGWKARSAPAL